MKSQQNLAFQNLKLVFSNLNYLIIAILIAFFFYALNVLIFGYKFFIHAFSSYEFFNALKFIMNLLIGFNETVLFASYITVITISILFGILFSLIIYKIKFAKETNKKKVGILTKVGIFLGVLAPGCAVCGIGLISVLGLSSVFLNFFPYDGLELSILAILILIYSIYYTSKNLTVCRIK